MKLYFYVKISCLIVKNKGLYCLKFYKMKFYRAENHNLQQNQFESWLEVLPALLMHNTIIQHALLLEPQFYIQLVNRPHFGT